jgi:hypothetical protein
VVAALAAVRPALVRKIEFEQEALDLLDMIRIFRRKEQVNVDRRRLGCLDAQSQFDVGKDQSDIGEASLALLLDNLLVAFNAEVVGNTQRSDGRVRRFDCTEKGFPRICPRVLVIAGRARRMDVRVPTMPY